jgi:hypothetical protein
MSDKWILLTAGFFPDEIVSAAKRTESQARRLFPFTRVIRLSVDNVRDYCPKVTSKYPEKFSYDTPFYGFSAWKIEAINNALQGEYGECDGVVWVDAGCEINPSLITKAKFRRALKLTSLQGHLVFALKTPEIKFTKKKAFELFPRAIGIDGDIQYQATYFILYGKDGLKIIDQMFNIIYNDLNILDPGILEANESDELVLPKCEQSILSLALKSLPRVTSMKVPPAGNRGFVSELRALFAPVWLSRNRTGDSIIPKWIRWMP